MSATDSSIELSDDEFAALLGDGLGEPLVQIKQEVLDWEEEKMDSEAVESMEKVEITAMVGADVLIFSCDCSLLASPFSRLVKEIPMSSPTGRRR